MFDLDDDGPSAKSTHYLVSSMNYSTNQRIYYKWATGTLWECNYQYQVPHDDVDQLLTEIVNKYPGRNLIVEPV